MKKLLLLFALLLLPLCSIRAWNIEDALGVKIGMSKPQFKTAMQKTLVPINEWMRKLYPDLDTLTVDKDENGNYKIEILHQQQLGARIPSTLFLPVSTDDIFKFGITITTKFAEDKLTFLLVHYSLDYRNPSGECSNPSSLYSFLSCITGWNEDQSEPLSIKPASAYSNEKCFFFKFDAPSKFITPLTDCSTVYGISFKYDVFADYYMMSSDTYESMFNTIKKGSE